MEKEQSSLDLARTEQVWVLGGGALVDGDLCVCVIVRVYKGSVNIS